MGEGISEERRKNEKEGEIENRLYILPKYRDGYGYIYQRKDRQRAKAAKRRNARMAWHLFSLLPFPFVSIHLLLSHNAHAKMLSHTSKIKAPHTPHNHHQAHTPPYIPTNKNVPHTHTHGELRQQACKQEN